MKKYIFLDIDGVLHEATYRPTKTERFQRSKCELINNLVKATNAEIVISSSWGYCLDTIEKLQKSGMNTDSIIGGTQHLELGSDFLCRGNSIAKWLSEHHDFNDDYEYVIIDDNCDILLSQINNFVYINVETGITDNDIKKCKRVLNGKKYNGKVQLTHLINF